MTPRERRPTREKRKGFAVVSDEIRKLAESANEQAKIIGRICRI
jgi:methyl-accepting chemotaxis protein